jgi:hypothetical protein
MTIRRLLTASVMACAMLAAGLAVASPAQAAVCQVHVGVTYREGTIVHGHGSIDSSCTPQTGPVSVVLQRKSWYGWGEAMSTKVLYGGGAQGHVTFNCGGYGTQSWRTVVFATTVGGGPARKISNEIRFFCG